MTAMTRSHRRSQQHTVDFLFTLSLLGVFAVTAVLVTLFGANTYERIVESSRCSYETSNSLSYVREKIRQGDTSAGISIIRLENNDVLEIQSTVNDASFVTYIYFSDGELKELYQPLGEPLPLASGQSILTLHGFTMEQLSDSLFRFTAFDENGDSDEIIVNMNCHA